MTMEKLRHCFKNRHSDVEHDYLRDSPTFKENWGILMVVVGMCSGKYLPFLNVFWIVVHLPFLLYTAYYAIVQFFDFGLFSATVHYILMMISVSSSIVNTQLHRENLEAIVKQMDEDFFVYGDTIDLETQELIKRDHKETKKRKNLYATGLVILFIMAAFVSMAVFPFIFSNDAKDHTSQYLHWGLPVVTWYPLKASYSINYFWILFIEYWIAYIIIMVLAGTDVPFLCYTEEGVHQMRALGHNIRYLFRRARYVYNKRYASGEVSFNDPKFVECVKICMNESVQHHHAIIKFFDNLAKLYFFILLVIMLGSTFLLCISGILFVSPDVAMKAKLQFLAYLLVVLFHIFTFSWYGELMSEMSFKIRDLLYESEWEEASGGMRQYILIMQAYMGKPIVFTAGGFMVCNLNTFGNVLSSSYSYFNLLSVMMARDDNK